MNNIIEMIERPAAGRIDAAQSDAAAPGGSLLPAQHVLVVHQSSGARDYLGDVLEAGGYDCRFAADLPAAEREIARRAPDLILLDGQTAAADTSAFLVRLSWRKQRVVVIGVAPQSALAQRFRLCGVAAVLEQTADPIAMLRALRAVIGSAEPPPERRTVVGAAWQALQARLPAWLRAAA
jgi:DNA-binding response OmpR family regulator